MAQLQRAESLGPLETARAAVRALYGADPSAQAQANAWLLSFAGTAAAWDVGRQLYLEPEEEVQYFGANLLFTKVRGEWHGLADEAKASVYTGLLGLLQQLPAAGGGWRKLPPGAKRLCLALAAAAVRSTQAAERYVASALELAAASPAASLELLGGLPAELLAQEAALADGAMSPARPELRALLPRALDALQSAVGSMGHAALGGGGGHERAAAECSTACLRALQQWLALQAGGSLLLLGERYPQLVAAAFAALAVADDDLNAAAADAVVELLSASNTTLAPSNEKAHAAALHVAELLERHGGALALPTLNGQAGAAVDERSYHFCRAACAFAERAVDLIASGAGGGRLLGVPRLLLGCLAAEVRVAELTVEFWCGLQDTPLAQRPDDLRQPLYRELLRITLAQAALPSDFTGWDDADVDEDEWHRFREQAASEVLRTCLLLLHTEAVEAIRAELTPPAGADAPSWQRLEGAIFATRCLHIELKQSLIPNGGDHLSLPPQLLAAHQAAVSSLLAQLLTPIAEGRLGTPPLAAPPLIESAARLVGAYAKWIAKERPALVQGALRFVLETALRTPAAADHAAEAFRSLCVHARKQLASAETFGAILAAVEPCFAAESLSADLRVALAEGLGRLVASLPRAADAQAALASLLRAPCAALSAALQQPPPPPVSPGAPPSEAAAERGAAVAVQLRLLTAAVRFCDGFKEEGHPALPALQGCWPLVQAVAERHATADVVGALCELYCKSMVVLRRLLLPLLPPMLMQLTRIFGGMPLPAPLECVTQAVEAYGKEDDESPAACALSDALAALVESVCAHLSSGQDAEGRPELLTSFFELCHRTLVFAPGLLLSLPSADALFDAAIGCVTHQEFTHTRAALTFVCLFIAGTESAGPYRETSACCLQKSGARLLLQSLRGLAALSPDNLIDHQAECLRVLVDACPSAIQQWLVAALSDPSFSSGAVEPKGATMAAFAQLLVRQSALSTGDFTSVCRSLADICRGKLAPDSLNRFLQAAG